LEVLKIPECVERRNFNEMLRGDMSLMGHLFRGGNTSSIRTWRLVLNVVNVYLSQSA
jgi:hypothetical protein